MLVKVKGRWYNLEGLNDSEKKKLGIKEDYSEILKELKETPEEVKKSPVKKIKEDD